MRNRAIILGDGGKAKELARMIASGDTQVIMPIEQHDSDLLDKVADRLKAEMIETYPKNINGVKVPTPFTHFSYRGMCNLLDKVIAEMKSEVDE